jgi:nucleotide-binding universal stress UspA family protein
MALIVKSRSAIVSPGDSMLIRHVLCPVDFSDASSRALDHAAAIARWYNARLTLLTVFTISSVMDVPARTLDDAERARLTRALQRLSARVPGTVTTTIEVAEASEAHEAILARAKEMHADLLVMGTHGRSGFRRLAMGSVTERVLRDPPCPVLVVPPHASMQAPEGAVQFRHIVCAVDFSTGSLAALSFALSIAQEAEAELLVLNVIEVPPELTEPGVPPIDVDAIRANAEAERLRKLRALIPTDARKFCTVETAVAEAASDHAILQACDARKAELAVLGINHHSALDRLVFGSTAARVTRAAPCPVLLVPEIAVSRKGR